MRWSRRPGLGGVGEVYRARDTRLDTAAFVNVTPDKSHYRATAWPPDNEREPLSMPLGLELEG
jgi:hypothetical protein